jgi:hypothetical protein
MTLFNFLASLFSSRRDRGTGRGRNPSRTRPAVEPLEDRQLLSSALYPGQYLYPGGPVVSSPNHDFQLALRSDGDLVEYGPRNDKVWESYTGGRGVIYATLQTDGNFVLYGHPHANGSLNPIKGFGTDHHPGDVLRVQDDGNVVIFQGGAPGGNPLWSTNTAGADAGLFLTPGNVVYSPNRNFSLALRTNGYLSALGPDQFSIWSTPFQGRFIRVIEAILQTDGNLVLYGPNNADGTAHPVWASNTGGHPHDVLRVQDDGNVVIYQFGHPLWATNTAGRDAALYLRPGQSVSSPDGRVKLTLKPEGNLVVTNTPFDWVDFDSGVHGRAIEAILQTDGNLVLYGPANADGSAHPLWASNTGGHPGATIQFQNPDYGIGIFIYDRAGHLIFARTSSA